MDMPLLYLFSGIVLLGVSGETLMRGAVSTALHLRVPPLVIGLTIVALGTSAPELTVSLDAAAAGRPDIAVGNVVGSNIANVLLVFGLLTLMRPTATPDTSGDHRRDGMFMLAVSVVFTGLVLSGAVGRVAGVALLAALIAYIAYVYRAARSGHEAESPSVAGNMMGGGLGRSLFVLAVGLAGIIWGADLMVEGAVGVARLWGLSEAAIGLGVVAIGTSLPELAVSAIALRRGAVGLAVGNIIGSNIANILLIIGLTAAVIPLSVADIIATRDIWVMLAAAALVMRNMWGRVPRIEGAAYIALYALYMAWLYAA